MNCLSCTHYSPLNDTTGECRESPPKIFVLPVRSLQGDGIACQAMFPQVHGSNWCGYYEEEDRSFEGA